MYNNVINPEKESKETDFRRIQCEAAEAGFQIGALKSNFDWLVDFKPKLIDKARHQGGSNLKTRPSG